MQSVHVQSFVWRSGSSPASFPRIQAGNLAQMQGVLVAVTLPPPTSFTATTCSHLSACIHVCDQGSVLQCINNFFFFLLFHFHDFFTPYNYYSIQGLYYNLELFRVRERQIPVDVVEMKGQFVGAISLRHLLLLNNVGSHLCTAQKCLFAVTFFVLHFVLW